MESWWNHGWPEQENHNSRIKSRISNKFYESHRLWIDVLTPTAFQLESTFDTFDQRVLVEPNLKGVRFTWRWPWHPERWIRCQGAARGNSSPQVVAVGIAVGIYKFHKPIWKSQYDIRMTSVWHPYDICVTSVWHPYGAEYETRPNKDDQQHWCQLHSRFLTQTL